MRSDLAVIAFFILTAGIGSGEAYLEVSEVSMALRGEDAMFQLNYTLDAFSRLYVLTLGCRYLEQDLLSLFKSYSNVSMLRADPYTASLLVKGAGRNNSGYYLFDSMPLGAKVARFTVVYPGGLDRTFYNVSSTPNVFCEA